MHQHDNKGLVQNQPVPVHDTQWGPAYICFNCKVRTFLWHQTYFWEFRLGLKVQLRGSVEMQGCWGCTRVCVFTRVLLSRVLPAGLEGVSPNSSQEGLATATATHTHTHIRATPLFHFSCTSVEVCVFLTFDVKWGPVWMDWTQTPHCSWYLSPAGDRITPVQHFYSFCGD